MVFCYKYHSDLLWENCSCDWENFWRLKAENLQKFEIPRTIFSNTERSEHFLKQNYLLTQKNCKYVGGKVGKI